MPDRFSTITTQSAHFLARKAAFVGVHFVDVPLFSCTSPVVPSFLTSLRVSGPVSDHEKLVLPLASIRDRFLFSHFALFNERHGIPPCVLGPGCRVLEASPASGAKYLAPGSPRRLV